MLYFRVFKSQRCLSDHCSNIGLSLFFLKLNPLGYKVSNGDLAFNEGIGGYEGRSSFGLSRSDDLHRSSSSFCQYSLSLYFPLCGY